MILIRNAATIFLSIMLGFNALAQDEQMIKIATDSGEMVIKLYEETPIHKANFVKLVSEGFYDGTVFHRVIENFMIQGGDPNSKEGATGIVGQGGPGYKVPGEINRRYIHVKGALSAARQGDNVNPNRESSGSQFYIVQGRTFTDEALDQFEARINQDIRTRMIQAFLSAQENVEYKYRLALAKKEKDQEAVKALFEEINPIIDAKLGDKVFAYTPEERELYKTIGGTPHLDMQYTVFGMVTEGLEVVDIIAATPKNGERPVNPVRMTMSLVE